MGTHLDLPSEVHDHFRKANVLHGYVEKNLSEATKYALEIGEELTAAKKAIPHGGWEEECVRLFDGSVRTAQFYMQFAKHITALPKAQKSALLLLETTLDGAAKAAKRLINPKSPSKPKPKTDPPDNPASPPRETETVTADDVAISVATIGKDNPDYGKCPNCAGTKWNDDGDGVKCRKCNHPYGEPNGDVDDDRLATQRSKTIKTAEALMRAFDDLQTMKAKACHKDTIATCKTLIDTAKKWK